MSETQGLVRLASVDDAAQLVRLWGLLFEDVDTDLGETWVGHAQAWFVRFASDPQSARFPVVELGDAVVATAIGTLELGVPNPMCPRGRTVRLANLVTHPDHRGRGYGTALARDLVEWARSIGADRVDLSATPEGQRIYDRSGFVLTTAPRMKLIL